MRVLTPLDFRARKSSANLRAIAVVVWPRKLRCSDMTVCTAHSRWCAAVSADEIRLTSSSVAKACSDACCWSIRVISIGTTRWIKMGNKGGVAVHRGMAKMKVAIRRQRSVSPTFAASTSSDQTTSRNLEGGIIPRHLSTSMAGPLPARAIARALRTTCFGCLSTGKASSLGAVSAVLAKLLVKILLNNRSSTFEPLANSVSNYTSNCICVECVRVQCMSSFV